MRSLLVIAVVLGACAPSAALEGPASPAASAVQAPTPSASATTAARAYREITVLGDFMRPSPDGQLVLSLVQGSKSTGAVPGHFVIQRLDGTVSGQLDNLTAMGRPEWLPDSSGVFIELAAGQRAGPLGVLEPDGRLIETGLDDANPLLSPDGRWIAAERQEGCCVAIRTHEIWIAPRAGGTVRTLVTSTDPAPQPVSFLGWSPSDAVIYSDGAHIRSVTLDGRSTELVGSPIGRSKIVRSAVSPDGRVILGCAADPLAFWVIANGVAADLGAEPAWPLRIPWCSQPDEVIWLGGHELPVRGAGGELFAFDATTGARRALALPAGATLVGASGDTLLLSINGDLHLLAAGALRQVGLPSGGSSIRPIDGGRFFLMNGRSGYLIG